MSTLSDAAALPPNTATNMAIEPVVSRKKVHIIGGGTVNYISAHLALFSPAYGATAQLLKPLCERHEEMQVILHLTKAAGGDELETNADLLHLIDQLTQDADTKIIFMNAAVCDVYAESDELKEIGKYAPRLRSRQLPPEGLPVQLLPYPKIVQRIRKHRKDIFLVAFKQTAGHTPDEQYIEALGLLKEASANLVLANDSKTRMNMIVTPEEARYCQTTVRDEALKGLVDMAYERSSLTFTRSTVVPGDPVPWASELIPESLRKVVDYCIEKGAYKPFGGSTVGHFAAKVNDTTFLTSRRKTNFNNLKALGLVKVETDGPDNVIAYGFKPSVGGQSQRIVFTEHEDMDCIVHFHCPIRPGSSVPQVPQKPYECGSHECGKNTSKGLKRFGNLKAVYLEEHGPNIVFNRRIDPQEVIDFIDANFDLSEKTGGLVSLSQIRKTHDLDDLQTVVRQRGNGRVHDDKVLAVN